MSGVTTPQRRTTVAVAIAAAIVAATVGVMAATSIASVEHQSLAGPLGNGGVFALFCLVGAVIVAARPANRVGWAMLVGGALAAVGGAAVALARHGITHTPTAVPSVALFAIGGQALQGLGWLSVTLVAPAFFPDLERIERCWIATALVVIAVAAVCDPLLDARADLRNIGSWHNPVAPTGPASLLAAVAFVAHIPLTLVTTVGVIRLLWRRWRTGDRIRRRQLRLFAIAAALPVVAAPVAIATASGSWIFAVAAVPLPIAMGVSVLARGLYDLRSAANRTLVWLTLSAVVAGLYVLVIGGAATIGHVDRDAAWLPWVAAIVLALCVAPLRDVLQRGVNRITFGRWDEPYEVLATLGQGLEASGDTDRLLADVVAELGALDLDAVSIHDDEGHTLAGDPARPDDGDIDTVDLFAYGERVGELRYRRPMNPLRARDRQLIDDLAGHLGGVVHARRLHRDLQQALERVVLGREEERRRLRRDLHDGLGPALAGHLLRLDAIAAKVEPAAPARADIDSFRDELRSTVLDVRRVVEGLRPPALDELGLTGALQQAGARLTGGSRVDFHLCVATLPPLPAAAEVAAFRVVTEAVTNVVRHANATRCRVSIDTTNSELRVVVTDDGSGLPPGPFEGHGMQTMRERAEELGGTMQVTSPPGTTISVLLPLRRQRIAEPSLESAP